MTDLLRLLRERTGDLHRSVEDAVALPGSVGDRDDYVALLQRFLDLHLALERRLARPAWTARWAALGVDLAAHRRVPALQDDLRRLGRLHPGRPVHLPPLDTFASALGAWYVLEGSAVGGRVLLPGLRAAAGDVPTAFFAGAGRTGSWPSARAALRRAGADLSDADAEAAALGAQGVFEAFGRHLSAAARTGDRVAGPAA